MKTQERIHSDVLPETITTIWLVEDNNAFRSVVKRVLDDVADFCCSQNFASSETLLEALQRFTAPDVILLDVALPGMSGLDAISKIKTLAPDTHIVMLTVFDDQKKIYQAVGAGASGYLLKTSSEEEIAAAIRHVVQGGVPMHQKVARSVWEMFAEMAVPRQDRGITSREREILQAIVEGSANKEIAGKLAISIHTVDAHLRHIYKKLGVNSRSAAASRALKERLL